MKDVDKVLAVFRCDPRTVSRAAAGDWRAITRWRNLAKRPRQRRDVRPEAFGSLTVNLAAVAGIPVRSCLACCNFEAGFRSL